MRAKDILSKSEKILDKYGADWRNSSIEVIDGTTYVVFKYYGGTNDTVDMNDDSWDEISDLDGVVDVGYGYGYGIEGKYEDSLLIELDDSIVESTKSTRKSLKEKKIDLTDDDLYNLLSDCFIDSAQLIVDGDYGVHAMLWRPEVRVSAYFQFVDRQNIIQLPARDISDIEFDVNGIVFYTKNATIFVNCYRDIPKLKDRLGGWLDTTF